MSTIASIVSLAFRLYGFLILVRVLLSWVSLDSHQPRLDHPLIRLMDRITNPVLVPLRRLIPPIGGAIDVSPVVALIVLELVRMLVVSILLRL